MLTEKYLWKFKVLRFSVVYAWWRGFFLFEWRVGVRFVGGLLVVF